MQLKRKKANDVKYYAVKVGRRPGIYDKWKDCMDQISGFKGAQFKSFPSREDASSYLAGHDPSEDPTSPSYAPKFYGVRSGKIPGVYTSWKDAQVQVTGVTKPKYKQFATREEAEAFVNGDDEEEGEPPARRRKSSTNVAAASQAAAATNSGRRAGASSSSGYTIDDDVEIFSSDEDDAEVVTTRVNGVTKKYEIKPKPVGGRKSELPVLKIYTDGSALANGKKSARAGVGVWFGEGSPLNISEPLLGDRPTNNRAELTAISRAIEIAPAHREVLIYTDSKYAINCVTLWHQKWARAGWKTASGKAVENQDLIEEILDRIEDRRTKYGVSINFEWIEGHAGHPGNEAADRLAVAGAQRA